MELLSNINKNSFFFFLADEMVPSVFISRARWTPAAWDRRSGCPAAAAGCWSWRTRGSRLPPGAEGPRGGLGRFLRPASASWSFPRRSGPRAAGGGLSPPSACRIQTVRFLCGFWSLSRLVMRSCRLLIYGAFRFYINTLGRLAKMEPQWNKSSRLNGFLAMTVLK